MSTATGATSPGSFFMVMNDWLVNTPTFVEDRYYMALYMAPVCDPDLLLPGPVVQAEGDIAYYPNGEVIDGAFYCSYSYRNRPREIRASRTAPLPDFFEPFLLPRGRREPVRFDGPMAYFPERFSSLGLVLTEALTAKPELHLEFRIRTEALDSSRQAVYLTAGGITHSGFRIMTAHDFQAVLQPIGGEALPLGTVRPDRWSTFSIHLSPEGVRVSLNGREAQFAPGTFLRKISFGGLYERPTAHRTGCAFTLDTAGIQIA